MEANRPQRIVMAGGTGFLGTVLRDYFVAQGYEVVILTRQIQEKTPGVTYVQWDAREKGPWMVALEGARAVINLCGRSVDCRYTAANRKAIYESRLVPTRLLGEAIALCEQVPPVWINLSSATLYRHAEDRPMDEYGGEAGTGFSVDVVQQWERALDEAQVPGTRKVALRCAMVMGPQGGPWPVLRRLARMGVGGAAGPGTQYMSWLHHQDFARCVAFILDTPSLTGAVNTAAPDPLKNHLFMKLLRRAEDIPFGIPIPTPLVRLGAWAQRTEAELLLKSRWVVPTRLQEAGFAFQYPTWAGAAGELAEPNMAAPIPSHPESAVSFTKVKGAAAYPWG